MFDVITNAASATAAFVAPYLPYAAAAVGGAALATGVIYAPSAIEAVSRYRAERAERQAEAAISDEMAAFHAAA